MDVEQEIRDPIGESPAGPDAMSLSLQAERTPGDSDCDNISFRLFRFFGQLLG